MMMAMMIMMNTKALFNIYCQNVLDKLVHIIFQECSTDEINHNLFLIPAAWFEVGTKEEILKKIIFNNNK